MHLHVMNALLLSLLNVFLVSPRKLLWPVPIICVTFLIVHATRLEFLMLMSPSTPLLVVIFILTLF